MSFGRYQFLSWARRGIAGSVSEKDTLGKRDGTAIERARIPFAVELTSGDTVTQNVALLGPGDITGINANSIIRTEPLNSTGDFEPNYLPCVEFYDEDFPFRYTPATAAGNNLKLRPWLALVVLKVDEFVDTPRREPLASIQIINQEVLPPHDELHLWCHMHSNLPHEESEFDTFLDGLEADVKKDPDGIYSRLLCPRKLAPKVHYHAFLIPTFETGRRAGLGQTTTGVPAQKPAWPNDANEYPVYCRFEFRTGKNFDFEYLVKQLKPRVMDDRVGVREMDCSRPGFIRVDADAEVRAPNPPTLLLEGAVMAPNAKRSSFPPKTMPQPFFDDIEPLVNLNRTRVQSNNEDPFVSVPFYGMYHALRRDRQAAGKRDVPVFNPDSTDWYNDLNRDPRTRVPAGFGQRVVQENQEKFADLAWKQLGDVLEANRRLKQSRFTAAIMQRLYLRNIAEQEAPDFLTLTRPMNSRLLGTRGTIHNDIRTSRISETVFTGTFARMTRRTTSIVRGLASRPNGSGGFDLNKTLPKMNLRNGIRPDKQGTFKPVSVLRNITTLTAPSTAAKVKVWSAQSNLVEGFAMNQDGFAGGLPSVKDWTVRFDPKRFKFDTDLLSGIRINNPTRIDRQTGGIRVQPSTIRRKPVPRQNQPLDAVVRTNKALKKPRKILLVTTRIADNKLTTMAHNSQVRAAYKHVNQRLTFDVKQPLSPALATAATVRQIDRAILPDKAYAKRIGQVLRWPTGTFRPVPEAFLPAMAYPDFPAPTYQYLIDIDKEFLLPNLELIENNTFSLLKTNQTFIESYLVGMNDEMGRELMWREYPTDMRGSYFRQFWDVSGFVTPDTTPQDAQSLKDIEPIHNWPRRSLLGRHNARDAEGDDEQLIFVIRGDLLKKFPNTVVFVQKAIANPDPDAAIKTAIRSGEMTDAQVAAEIRFPQYQAQIDPDIKLLGFDLTIKEASGDTKTASVDSNGRRNPKDDLGWYFIIAEVPGEPRFGMDISFSPNVDDNLTWDDLSWENLPSDTRFITAQRRPSARTQRGRTAPFPTNPDLGTWGRSSADMAAILLQRPAMVAIHATEMLKQPVPTTLDNKLPSINLFTHLQGINLRRR